MQRLYLQIYATVLLVLAVFVGAAAVTWKLAEEETPQYLDIAAELTGALLPDADAPPSRTRRRSTPCTASCASTSRSIVATA